MSSEMRQEAILAEPPSAASSELFVLPDRLIKTCLGSDKDVLCDLIDDMKAFGIFKLPYDVVDVKFTDSQTGGDKLLIKNLHLTHELESYRGLFQEGLKTPNFALGNVFYNTSFDLCPSTDHSEREAEARAHCDVAAIVLIIALATSNVDKKVTENKRAKLGIGKSKHQHYRHITYLNLPKIVIERERHASQSDSHRIVKMHLRRGHSRKQHFGQGNAQIKLIWVAPTFVNADDSYVPREKYQATAAA